MITFNRTPPDYKSLPPGTTVRGVRFTNSRLGQAMGVVCFGYFLVDLILYSQLRKTSDIVAALFWALFFQLWTKTEFYKHTINEKETT